MPAVPHVVHGALAEWLGDVRSSAAAMTVLTMAADSVTCMGVASRDPLRSSHACQIALDGL